jgi:glutathione S-transferase
VPILYHRAPVGNCAKTLITLAEKNIVFHGEYVDAPLERGPDDLIAKASQSGSLPVFVDDDGTTLAESSAIAEYLEETRPEKPLMPADPTGRWQARVWFKFVNEDLAPAVSLLAWHTWGRPHLTAARHAELCASVVTLTAPDRVHYWQEALAGFSAARLNEARRKIAGVIALLEQRLGAHSHVAGDDYSLADIDVWPFAEPLPRLVPELASPSLMPATTAWVERMRRRPAVIAATQGARDVDWIPGPEPIRWG